MKLHFMILVAGVTLGANPTTSFATGPHLAIGGGNQSCEVFRGIGPATDVFPLLFILKQP
jgi:hypothetical protein